MQIFAETPTLLLEMKKQFKGTGNRGKPKIFAENRRKAQIGLRHLRSITFSSARISNFSAQSLALPGLSLVLRRACCIQESGFLDVGQRLHIG